MTTPGGGLLGCDVACFTTRGPSGNATSTTTDPVVASPPAWVLTTLVYLSSLSKVACGHGHSSITVYLMLATYCIPSRVERQQLLLMSIYIMRMVVVVLIILAKLFNIVP